MDEMTPRQKQLEEAYEMIRLASHKEKAILFKSLISNINEYDERLRQPENEFYPYSELSYSAFREIETFILSFVGYRAGWVRDALLAHYKKPGRQNSYNAEEKIENCIFLFWLTRKGASPTQAAKLLARLHGDISMSKSRTNDMTKAYNAFKDEPIYQELEQAESFKQLIEISVHSLPSYLEFSFTKQNLLTEEKASHQAATAFRQMWQEVINYMKESHSFIREKDRSYPEIFGEIIELLDKDYDDPLDYFYPIKERAPDHQWQFIQYFREYLNTATLFNPSIDSTDNATG